ncbi:tRNA nucleotidyltransferase (CCA-adding enzyme) [Deferribacter desulfuricans SSM1]|uniref:tRNA nucleotidyltransferase (CCA-adding enzyme) n=1 Tax=Deferribacter desulfuricans (strain DSM 14783 / JCM 11476 / NBRC 101012 / SSM1) TaxID=639282 RepID=D3PAE6_DEFDS|nr:HD domain-containing protein [Deferribacter desulfuricans]BAI79569.1 tRNA nucleotidyltransferase (CCA-adding enzyme) [Deferribacter desulfuricans SSM1]
MVKLIIDSLKALPFFEVLEDLSEYEFYFVGGFVRDVLLGKKAKDVDLVPFGIDYKDFAWLLKKKLQATSVPFKDNIRLILKDFVIDVSKPRGKNIIEDLQKRDFTINNLATDIKGNIIGDTNDLKNKVIKYVYEDVFNDDPVRILRAFRFVSQLDFDIENKTFEKIFREKNLLKNAPFERIYDELIKLLKGKSNFKALKLMQHSEVLFTLFPEFKNIEGLPQGKYHQDCALTHTFRVVEKTRDITDKLNKNDETKNILLLSAFFHDVGKAVAGERNNHKNFVGHEEESAKIAEKYLKKFPIKKKNLKEVLHLIKKHTKIRIYASEKAKDNTLKRFIYNNAELLEEIILFTLADNLTKGHNINDIYETIIRIRKLSKELDWSKKELINGNTLIELNIPDKTKYATILKDVHEKLVIGILPTKEEAIKYILDRYLK